MKVREIMSNRVLSLRHNDTVLQAAEILSKNNVGSLPIVTDGELVGILTDRDIVLRCVAGRCDATQMRIGEIMSTRLVTVSPEDSVGRAMDVMAQNKVRRLPVTEGKRVVGMLSLADVARATTSERLSETVSEISQPHRPKI